MDKWTSRFLIISSVVLMRLGYPLWLGICMVVPAIFLGGGEEDDDKQRNSSGGKRSSRSNAA